MRWSQITLGALMGLEGVLSHAGSHGVGGGRDPRDLKARPVFAPAKKSEEPFALEHMSLLLEARQAGTKDSARLFISIDGSCGPGITCLGSGFGNCCGQNGWCGSSNSYCGEGCKPDFGTCSQAGLSVQRRAVMNEPRTEPLKLSTDGSCGIGSSCLGSKWGDCCSHDGWCGGSEVYCGAGCKEGFGLCRSDGSLDRRDEPVACEAPSSTTTTSVGAATTPTPQLSTITITRTSTSAPAQTTTVRTSTSASAQVTTVRTSTTTSTPTTSTRPTTTTTTAPAPTLKVSKDGKCGAAVMQTCLGSSIFVGPCCSKSGKCGLTSCLRLLGCQPGYGLCI